jgi:hypothetical protein
MTRMSTISKKKAYIKYHGMGLSDKKRVFLPFGIIFILDIQVYRNVFFVLNIKMNLIR